MLDERHFTRQSGIIDATKLTQKILIIGAGSVGGWTALSLGKLGCTDITVMDFDIVELHNVGPQIYKAIDEETKKVQALQERLGFLLENPIEVIDSKWTPDFDMSDYDIVIAAVDNITNRKEIFENLVAITHNPGKPFLFIDARMASYGIEIYTTHTDRSNECLAYRETLFEESETLEIPCSERSVVFNVFVVAGMIGSIIAHHANGDEIPKELTIDLRNFTLYK